MKKDETIFKKADIVEKLLQLSLNRVRGLKKALRDPHMLAHEAKTRIPELDAKIDETLDNLIEFQKLAGE